MQVEDVQAEDVQAEDMQAEDMAIRALLGTVQQFYAQDGMRNTREGVVRKKRHLGVLFGLVGRLARIRIVNMLLLAGVVLGYRIFTYPDRGARIYQFDPVIKNHRLFRRLNGCLEPAGITDISLNGRTLGLGDRLAVIARVVPLWRMAGLLTRQAKGPGMVHVCAVIAGATWLIYRCHRLPEEVRLVFFANDHAPGPAAMAHLARFEGRATGYIQHAPVTEIFPPLTFDLAVLFDRRSAACYAASARAHGVPVSDQVLILSPFTTSFRQPTLGPAPWRLGVCLSLLPRMEILPAVLGSLAARDDVAEIALRAHPRCRMALETLLVDPKIRLAPRDESPAEFFERTDIVLVPNSGVTIEALHQGRPTLFVPGMDDIVDDYYGFAANGIVPTFAPELLSDPDRIRDFFSPAWTARFANHDATVEDTPDAAAARIAETVGVLIADPPDATARSTESPPALHADAAP